MTFVENTEIGPNLQHTIDTKGIKTVLRINLRAYQVFFYPKATQEDKDVVNLILRTNNLPELSEKDKTSEPRLQQLGFLEIYDDMTKRELIFDDNYTLKQKIDINKNRVIRGLDEVPFTVWKAEE